MQDKDDVQVDTSDRYSADVKLLSIELDLGESLLRRATPSNDRENDLTEEDVAGHMALIREQYAQVSLLP